jgi:hypothetical protein
VRRLRGRDRTVPGLRWVARRAGVPSSSGRAPTPTRGVRERPAVAVGAPVAALLSALSWLVFGVRFWLAWLVVDAGVLLYVVYGFLRIRHRIGPGGPGEGGLTPPRSGGPNPRPPRGRWWRRPGGGGVPARRKLGSCRMFDVVWSAGIAQVARGAGFPRSRRRWFRRP